MTDFKSFKKVQESLLNNSTTCQEITNHYLAKIATHKQINAFIEVYKDEALEQARCVDKKIKKGIAGKLAGMVLGIKDNLCYKNHKVSAASKALQNFTSLFSATVIKRLISEDAIIIGRLNCDEFAMGSSNENTIYGPVKNPINTSKVAGGSSGGSAAAVSAGLCLAALGSDTGGSVRQPASFCGVVGLKPTYSRVSRYGLIAYASSFDQIGPITNNVEDAALLLEIIAGADDFDSTCSSKPVQEYSKILPQKTKKRIAYIEECLESNYLDLEIKQSIKKKIVELKEEGHLVDPISFPYVDYLVPTYYVINTAEASSNLARFDGIHYGYRSKNITNIESTYVNSRTEGFGQEVKRRIMLGTFVLSAEYNEAYFSKAQKIRRIIQEKTKEIFKKYDFIISPTTPHTAFDIGKKQIDPTTMYLEDVFTVQANLTGHPAISIPLTKHSNKLPIGIQLMADHFQEAELLSFCDYISRQC